MGLQTEFGFTLPKGYVGHDGTLHRRGVMRLSTARDEIEPLRDPRITGPDDPYLTILVIGRVITELGTLDQVGDREVEGLFAADLAFLQDLYGIINFGDPADAEALQRAVLPVDRPDPADDVVDNPGFDVADDDVADDDVADDEVAGVGVQTGGESAGDDDLPLAKPRSTKGEKPASTSKRRSHIEEITPQKSS